MINFRSLLGITIRRYCFGYPADGLGFANFGEVSHRFAVVALRSPCWANMFHGPVWFPAEAAISV